MDLGKIIRNYRELNGLSLRQFAARCNDISAGYISIIELGANPATTKRRLYKHLPVSGVCS